MGFTNILQGFLFLFPSSAGTFYGKSEMEWGNEQTIRIILHSSSVISYGTTGTVYLPVVLCLSYHRFHCGTGMEFLTLDKRKKPTQIAIALEIKLGMRNIKASHLSNDHLPGYEVYDACMSGPLEDTHTRIHFDGRNKRGAVRSVCSSSQGDWAWWPMWKLKGEEPRKPFVSCSFSSTFGASALVVITKTNITSPLDFN